MFKIIKNTLCVLELHNFNYSIKELTFDIDDEIRQIKTPIRECKWCFKKQHHLMPKQNGSYVNWRTVKWDCTKPIKLTQNG
jgi:hypothetical protein